MSNTNTIIAERLVAFYRSDVWAIIKHRLEHCIQVEENTALNKIRQNDAQKALKHTSLADGVRAAILIVERISSEIQNDTLNADATLGVIENKQENNVGGNTWLQKILVKFRNKKDKASQ